MQSINTDSDRLIIFKLFKVTHFRILLIHPINPGVIKKICCVVLLYFTSGQVVLQLLHKCAYETKSPINYMTWMGIDYFRLSLQRCHVPSGSGKLKSGRLTPKFGETCYLHLHYWDGGSTFLRNVTQYHKISRCHHPEGH